MSTATCILFNVQRFSTEDGPGIRTTVFFKGCPLACPWCHNPEGLRAGPEVMWQSSICLGCGDCAASCSEQAIRLADGRVQIDRKRCTACGHCVDACPSGALERAGIEYGVPELLEEVSKDRTFYSTSGGGVTLSGGEPLMQHDFVTEFAARCRDEGLHVALDTSGFGRPEWLDPVLKSVDLVLFDLKLMDPTEHQRLTGVPIEGVLANLEHVVATGLPVWVRTPVIPGHTDSEENIRAIAAYLKANVSTLQRCDLLAFSNLCKSKYEMLGRQFPLDGRRLLTRQDMERLAEVTRAEGIDVVRWSGPTRIEAEAGKGWRCWFPNGEQRE
jgi:pyruvate formate lyase activating enzyme